MTETTLKFGPEWLRALSHGSGSGGGISGGGGGGGGSVSPPASPGSLSFQGSLGLPKFKVAEHRFSREEMLALYEKGLVPDDMTTDTAIFMEKCQPPVAFSNVSEEEKMAWHSGVNSEAVLRLTGGGRGGGGGLGARARGGSVDRGRGRGRGYSYRAGYDDGDEMGYGRRDTGPPGYLRGKSFDRSHSLHDGGSERPGWGDRNGLEVVSPRKEFGRGSTSDNWRNREPPAGGDERWRLKSTQRPADKWGGAGAGGGRGGGNWRSDGGVGGPQRRRIGDDDRRRDELPEWVTEAGGTGGSFDSTGAFHGDWGDDIYGGRESSEEKAPDSERSGAEYTDQPGRPSDKESPGPQSAHDEQPPRAPASPVKQPDPLLEPRQQQQLAPAAAEAPPPERPGSGTAAVLAAGLHQEGSADPPVSTSSRGGSGGGGGASSRGSGRGGGASEAASIQQLQETANQLVAGLMEDEREPAPQHPQQLQQQQHHPQQPQQHPQQPQQTGSPERRADTSLWFYTDPQGQVQGPFPAAEMLEWYRSGYFRPSLLVRRGCDQQFSQLGELERLWGRVPFAPGLHAPPILKSAAAAPPELDGGIAAVLQQQLVAQQQHQLLQQQLRQQAVAQALLKLQQAPEFLAQPPQQQQQIISQYLMQHQMADHLLHQPAPDFFSIQQGMMGKPAVTLSSVPGIPGIPSMHGIPGIPGIPGMSAPVAQPAGSNALQQLLQQMQQQQQQSAAAVSLPEPVSVPQPAAPVPRAADSSPDPIQSLMQQLSRAGQPSVSQPSASQPAASAAAAAPAESVWSGAERWPASQAAMAGIPGTAAVWAAREDAERKQRDEQVRQLQEVATAAAVRQEQERRALEEVRQREQQERQRWEEEQRRLEQERARRQQEEAQCEEQRRQEEARQLEEQRLREEQRQREEQQRLLEEAQRRQREEQQRQLEEQRQREEARILQEQRQREEQQRLAELQRQEERRRVEEAVREEKERKKQEKKREEQRKREEKAAQEEALRIQQEEERIRREEEEALREQEAEAQRRAQAQAEAERRAQEARVQPAPPPAVPAWGSQSEDTLSLSEIQRLQDRDRKERQHQEQLAQQRRREHELAAVVQQQQQQKLKWAAQPGSADNHVKSLAEIQAEQAREHAKRHAQQASERQQPDLQLSFHQAGVWTGTAAQNISWSQRAAAAVSSSPAAESPAAVPVRSAAATAAAAAAARPAPAPAVMVPTAAREAQSQARAAAPAPGAVWDSPPKQAATAGHWAAAAASKPNSTNSSSGGAGFWEPAVAGGKKKGAAAAQQAGKKKGKSKAAAETEAVVKIFQSVEPTADDDFHTWATITLTKMNSGVDVPTFISFLKDVESPYELHDYVRSYLGDGTAAREFGKQFVERRSRWRNSAKKPLQEDMLYAPAPAVNPAASAAPGPAVSNEFQDIKPKGRRGKNKNRTVDNSILGFSVTSAEGRLNVGERETIGN